MPLVTRQAESGKITVSATEPSTPLEGDLWYDTSNNILLGYDGSTFVQIGLALDAAHTWSADQKYTDNIETIFGSDGDSSILYDGTNMVIDPKLVGSGVVMVKGDIDFEGGIKIKSLISRVFDYFANSTLDNPFTKNEVVGTNTDDGVVTGVGNGRKVTTGTTSGSALSLTGTNYNFDMQEVLIYGIAQRSSATCDMWLGMCSTVDQSGDMLDYYDGTNNTYKEFVIRQNSFGQLDIATDVLIDTAITPFKILSTGNVQSMYLLVSGVWTLKATNSNTSYQPDPLGGAFFYVNNAATTNAVSAQFTRLRIVSLN